MPNINRVLDNEGNLVFPLTHTKAVVDDNGNTVENRLNAKANQIDTYTKAEINNLLVPANTEILVVTELPSSGQANKIYRVQGTDSYSDYGWNGSQFVKLAEYNGTNLYSSTGQATDGSMTQKAVTDEFENRTSYLSQVVLSGLTPLNWYIRASENNWIAASNTKDQCVLIPVSPGDVIKAVGGDNGQGGVWTPQVVFLTTNEKADKQPAPYAGGEQTYPVWASGVTKVAPNDAAFMYVRLKTSNINVTPTLYKISSIKDKVSELEDIAEDIEDMSSKIIPAPVWKNGTITTQGYSDSTTDRVLDPLVFGEEFDQVELRFQSDQAKYALYSISESGGTTVYELETSGGFILYPAVFKFVPDPSKQYVIRLAEGTTTRSNWTQLAKPLIIAYYNNPSYILDELDERISDIESGVKVDTIVPLYYSGSIATTGYDLSVQGNKITSELEFDPSKVKSITVHRRGTEVKFAIYYILNDTISAITNGYVTSDSEFIPQQGAKYVIRIVATAGNSEANMNAVPVSSYPELIINYFNSSDCIEGIKKQFQQIDKKYHGYNRNYSNITPLLNFEHKSISDQGIVDNQSTLLAKIPSIGCVEVKMNTPLGGFSVWKKVGNTITCLQEYTHYQYRYTGDYSSEYYVMLQLEGSGTIDTSIALIYTYSDEGKTLDYIPPSWAAGKKIAFTGDSIVQGRYPKNGSSSVNICMDKPWPNLVAEALGSEDFMNFSIGGALVYNNDWRSIQRNAGLITGYDIVFVCGGTNDYGNKTSQANFESAYSDMLDTLIANNTKVIVMTMAYRTRTVSSPVMSFLNYANSIKSIAALKNVPVIDLTRFTNSSEFKSHLVDGLHPDEIGQRMIADILLEQINFLN